MHTTAYLSSYFSRIFSKQDEPQPLLCGEIWKGKFSRGKVYANLDLWGSREVFSQELSTFEVGWEVFSKATIMPPTSNYNNSVE